MHIIVHGGRWYRELTNEEAKAMPLDALRGWNGRKAHPEFYRRLLEECLILIAEDDPHPQKTMAARHGVTDSAVSRWLKEARRL